MRDLYWPAMPQTASDSELSRHDDDAPVAGLLVVWSDGSPQLATMRIPPPGLVLGRTNLAGFEDDRLSRQHVRIRRSGTQFLVEDLGSRNGTFVGGAAVAAGELAVGPGAVLRIGRSLCLLVPDLRAFADSAVSHDGGVIAGPTLRRTWEAAARAARTGKTLLVTGESGVGKELVAKAFHAATGSTSELVAVNCAAIPAGVAERLLFGARKGAYSGADRDAPGYLAAADGGTLFLDEVAELELAVQAKLLRALETGELLPLGAARPQSVSVRVVAATLRDLRAEVAAGRFRDDLYFRIGRPDVAVPPLRERREEIPWLVSQATRAAGLPAHHSLVEACLMRAWPGNIRELLGEISAAAALAVEAGSTSVRADDLAPTAGVAFEASAREASAREETAPSPGTPTPLPPHDRIVAVLREMSGNVTRAAKQLGLHRNQLRRYLAKHPELGGGQAEGDAEAHDESGPEP